MAALSADMMAGKSFWLLLFTLLIAVLAFFGLTRSTHGSQDKQPHAGSMQRVEGKPHAMPVGGSPAGSGETAGLKEAPAPRSPIGDDKLKQIKHRDAPPRSRE